MTTFTKLSKSSPDTHTRTHTESSQSKEKYTKVELIISRNIKPLFTNNIANLTKNQPKPFA